jgi:DNA-binding XRE family transcriptional regulator/PHD/YefM family antitoxin component YafN of YafNO toxin-antitoxin module
LEGNMNKPVHMTTPGGEEIVILPAAEYRRLVDMAEDARDARIAEQALAEIAAGDTELLTQEEVEAFLDAVSPLAFWRQRRGLTQAALARQVGITQAYLAQIESRKRSGDVDLYRRLAHVLKTDLELVLPLEKPRAGAHKSARPKKRSLPR